VTSASPPRVRPRRSSPTPNRSLVSALDASGSLAGTAGATAAHPADPLGWAALGDAAVDAGEDPVTTYAYYRVGYHRGLDLLRKNGWKGSGYVRSEHPSNRGFLRCLAGLAEAAAPSERATRRNDAASSSTSSTRSPD
jgi:hypothetical protein